MLAGSSTKLGAARPARGRAHLLLHVGLLLGSVLGCLLEVLLALLVLLLGLLGLLLKGIVLRLFTGG